MLAIPHYLLLVIFLGTNNTAPNNAAPDNAARTTGSVAFDIGLISMLVLIAAVGLLFTGRYPRGISRTRDHK